MRIILSIMSCLMIVLVACSPATENLSATQTAFQEAVIAEVTNLATSNTNTPIPTITPSHTLSPTIISTSTPVPTNTAQPTLTHTPTSIPTSTSTRITPTTQPTHTHTVAPTQYIAGLLGLNPADITINLEDRGFECTNAQTITGGYVWTCEEDMISYLMRVDIYSFSTIVSVDYIDAGIGFFEEPNNDLAISFLGFIATAPYDNAEPIAAREWVETTLPTITSPGDIREAEFGGVKFQLFGPPTSRYLEFGDLGEDY